MKETIQKNHFHNPQIRSCNHGFNRINYICEMLIKYPQRKSVGSLFNLNLNLKFCLCFDRTGFKRFLKPYRMRFYLNNNYEKFGSIYSMPSGQLLDFIKC